MKSSELVNSVVITAALPVSRNTLMPEDILKLLNEEMELNVVPNLMRAQEDYLLYEDVYPILPNVKHYLIPSRAVGGKLRDVSLSDSTGNLYELARTQIGDRYFDNYDCFTLRRFYVKNNRVVLLGNVSNASAANINMVYYIKPNKLVLEERCGFIVTIQIGTDINGNTDSTKTTFVLDNVADNMITGKLDLMMGNPIYSMIKYDLVPSAADSLTSKVEFNSSDLESLDFQPVTGDYFASAGECCIPQIPEEMHTMLAHLGAARALESLGDQAGLQNTMAKVSQYKSNLFDVIGDRVDDAPLKINPRHGFIRKNPYRRRF